MFSFYITGKEKKARTGILHTPHGVIETPAFVPVATKGALRGIDFHSASDLGSRIFMLNTFHFFCNERYRTVESFKGLHKYLNIDYPLMTDSGGFQVFSFGFGREHGVGKISNIFPKDSLSQKEGDNLVKISEEGVSFSSPRDGKKMFLSPEVSISVQKTLGADIIFTFDECTSPLADYKYTKEAMERTHRWALRSIEAFGRRKKQALFGIVQGGEYKDLRTDSARFIGSLPFFGFGIGGSLGKSKKDMHRVLEWTTPLLPEEKPRHLLGIGEVDDILESVERGVDLFDCVIPTRWARHGVALLEKGRISLDSNKYLKEKGPISPYCKCPVCKNYSRSYIAHLLKEKELYGIMLLTEHNLFWMQSLLAEIRQAIKARKFTEFKKEIISPYCFHGQA